MALLGPEEMEWRMAEAIQVARSVGDAQLSQIGKGAAVKVDCIATAVLQVVKTHAGLPCASPCRQDLPKHE